MSTLHGPHLRSARPALPIGALPAGALLCAALLASPAAAHAQFGKLRDLGKAAAGKVVEKTAGDAVEKKIAGGAEGAEAKPTGVKFSENLLEITDARIAQLLRGLDAEAAAKPAAERRFLARDAAYREADRTREARAAAYEKEHAAWERRRDAQRACVDDVAAKHEGALRADADKGQAAASRAQGEVTPDREARLKALQARLQAAQARGDQAAMMALADTARRELSGVLAAANEANVSTQHMMATQAVMTDEMKKRCGDVGPEPKGPALAEWADPEAARREVREAGVRASGLTERQYDILRERVETYVRMKGRTGMTRYVFGAGELDALGKQLGSLQKRGDLTATAPWDPGAKRS